VSINIEHEAFARTDPKRSKNTVKPSVFIVLLGSASIHKNCALNVGEIDPRQGVRFFTIIVSLTVYFQMYMFVPIIKTVQLLGTFSE